MTKTKHFFKSLIMLPIIGFLCGGSGRPVDNNENTIKTKIYDSETLNLNTTSDNISAVTEETNNDLVVSMLSFTSTNVTQSIQFRVEINDDVSDANYYIGYYEEGNRYPAYLEYDVKDQKGNTKRLQTEIVQKANHGIGGSLGNQLFSSYCDIEVPYDYKVDTDSVELTHVYKADFKYDENGYVVSRDPDLDHPQSFKIEKFKTFSIRRLQDVLDTTFVKFAEYDNYLTITAKFDNFGAKIYENLSSTTKALYKKNKKNIDNGTIAVRTRLSIGGDTLLKVTKKDGTIEKLKSIAGDLKFFDEENYRTFLIPDLKKDAIKNFEIYASDISIELFNNSTKKIVPRSSITSRYGLIDFKMVDILNGDKTVAVKAVDIDQNINYSTLFIVFMVSFVVLYVGCAILYYFYLKKKDKKSEFKVLNNKQFIIINILGIIFLGALLLDILYIVARTTLFNNSLTVYNPLDWVIIVASVISICLGGYFIKYFFNVYKDYKEKIAREKLNLNSDKADDGTN